MLSAEYGKYEATVRSQLTQLRMETGSRRKQLA